MLACRTTGATRHLASVHRASVPLRFLHGATRAVQSYSGWRMAPLAAAAPPCGGEAFLWVDEQATNMGGVAGLPATGL